MVLVGLCAHAQLASLGRCVRPTLTSAARLPVETAGCAETEQPRLHVLVRQASPESDAKRTSLSVLHRLACIKVGASAVWDPSSALVRPASQVGDVKPTQTSVCHRRVASADAVWMTWPMSRVSAVRGLPVGDARAMWMSAHRFPAPMVGSVKTVLRPFRAHVLVDSPGCGAR
jgi:hypothetical protein